jgi:hypothetical protein
MVESCLVGTLALPSNVLAQALQPGRITLPTVVVNAQNTNTGAALRFTRFVGAEICSSALGTCSTMWAPSYDADLDAANQQQRLVVELRAVGA